MNKSRVWRYCSLSCVGPEGFAGGGALRGLPEAEEPRSARARGASQSKRLSGRGKGLHGRRQLFILSSNLEFSKCASCG